MTRPRLLLTLLAVYFTVSWKEWAGQGYAGSAMIWPNAGPSCSVVEAEKSETFRDDDELPANFSGIDVVTGKSVPAYTAKRQRPRERAEVKAAELKKEPHKYWDIKIKRVEEQELK